jgi:DNA-binding NtrC family response regulator
MTPAPGLILVVEDEPSLREPLEHLLRLRRYEVVSADTAEGALDAMRRHAVDAAIVDLRLKQGHGRDVIAGMPEKTPVIIFSATVSQSGALEKTRPRTHLVEKPCSLTWLIDRLEDILSES